MDNVVVFEAVDSTHAAALRLIEQVDNEELSLRATVLVAATQSRGVGRKSRRWSSPTGGLYLNWLGPRLSDQILARLPMIAAAAAHSAITAAGVEDAAIKWPNDILVEGRKLAGLLIHSRRGDAACVTVGFGLNVKPVTESLDEPIHAPISLAEIVGDEGLELRMLEAAVRFVKELQRSMTDFGPALERWRSLLIHRENDPMTVRLGNGDTMTGAFVGLTDEGFLRLLTDTGERVITSGDVIES